MEKKFDFGGWATRANLLCSDGRIIKEEYSNNNESIVKVGSMDNVDNMEKFIIEGINDLIPLYEKLS